MDNVGLVIIMEHEGTHAYAYECLEQDISMNSFKGRELFSDNQRLRLRHFFPDCLEERKTTPVAESLHSSLARPALRNIAVTAAYI